MFVSGFLYLSRFQCSLFDIFFKKKKLQFLRFLKNKKLPVSNVKQQSDFLFSRCLQNYSYLKNVGSLFKVIPRTVFIQKNQGDTTIVPNTGACEHKQNAKHHQLVNKQLYEETKQEQVKYYLSEQLSAGLDNQPGKKYSWKKKCTINRKGTSEKLKQQFWKTTEHF